MGLDALEWVTIGAIGLVIFIWGQDEIPQIVRSIGAVRKQLEAASKELKAMSNELSSNQARLTEAEPAGAPPSSAPATSAPMQDARPLPFENPTQDQILIENAKRLGISTEGKTRDEISQEIFSRHSVLA